jgi:hypothetical protein
MGELKITDEIAALSDEVSRLLSLLRGPEGRALKSADIFADSLAEKRNSLEALVAHGTPQELAMCLLGLIPTAKDLEAIDFPLDADVRIREARIALSVQAAMIAHRLLEGG